MMRHLIIILALLSCSSALLADNSEFEAQILFGRWARADAPINVMVTTKRVAVSEISVELICGDDIQTQTMPVEIDTWTTALVQLPLSVKGTLHSVQPYTLRIHSEAGDAELQGSVGLVDNQWHRNLLVEEGTGTWCGNCPRGIVAMRLLRETYPDTFVGMTLHFANSAHDEVMDYHDYGRFLVDNAYITMFPGATLNRQLYDADPYNDILGGYYDLALLDATPARFELRGEYIDDYTAVRLTATTEFDCLDASHEYRIAFACIENDVHQPGDDRYKQFNNYGNNAYGEFYGFEKFPQYIPADSMWYQEVTRYVTDMNGTPGSLPTDIELRREYVYSADMAIPATVLNGENCCFIGMLIDATTQEVLNCAEITADEVVHGAEVPLFYDTFRYGLFAKDYVRLDLDGRKPFSSMGLSVGDAWGIGQEDGNYHAFSTSYYSPGGQSDDWLILPRLNVDNVAEVKLSWRARSTNAKYQDSYEVLLSDGDTAPEDFTLLQAINKEQGEWTDRELTVNTADVSQMRIAFRNVTNNGEKLLLDDIRMETTAATDGIFTRTTTSPFIPVAYDLTGRPLSDGEARRGIIIEKSDDGHFVKRVLR